ncbi:hypothetical protein NSZ01_28200 [Nocardioides szechwanensis]|nr:hypothetical protein NSZ01_28200 [Nocardioides szechwanensis]
MKDYRPISVDDLMEQVILHGGQLALVHDGDLDEHDRIALLSRRATDRRARSRPRGEVARPPATDAIADSARLQAREFCRSAPCATSSRNAPRVTADSRS